MIELPDFTKTFEYENNFYLSSNPSRLGKIFAHYELFKIIKNLSGTVIECGIFKGNSFIRFASFRELFENSFSRKLIGFDTFETFPETNFKEDKQYRNKFIQYAGEQSISKKQLIKILKHKKLNENIELIKGDVVKTVPKYIEKNPSLKISLLNLDTDIYEPAVTILQYFWPKIVRGGILILDDYGVFPGETKAVDEYFKNKNIKILKYDFATTPCYIIKE